ncbi:MAG: glycogen synthase GlgA [Bacteroidales bacterium]|nr:glycogen synthase GlgA [Bacteroidales bacterium]MBN2762932.1 glycogen synthase GlgA [Bacteroidales bacterium]
MTDALKILLVASECVPFAKTGGLGDVAGTLPRFLQKLGHNVVIVMPLYSLIHQAKYKIQPVIQEMNVSLGHEQFTCGVRKTTLPESVPVYFIDYDPFFKRPHIYHNDDYSDFPDNPVRFAFLSKAALQLCHELNFSPDIVHANDWHTAILPAFLKRLCKDDHLFENTASVLTIHNIAYQGRYNYYYYHYTGLPAEDFTPDKFECMHAVNFLKGGIFFADMVNTVSKGYAEETLTPVGSHGLDHALKKRGKDYVGILNGVDYSEWNPATDPLIPANYSVSDMTGKQNCKRALQKQFGLQPLKKIPVIGMVSRLVEQKGFYVLSECMEAMLNNMDAQFVLLGAGDNKLEYLYDSLYHRYPGKAGIYIGYSNELAHLIEAGSDFFLMPSVSEPCGLNQNYSMKYGTLPVVRAIGGLNDTVENYNQKTGEGTGFKFWELSGKAIYNTVAWALDTYTNRKPHFKKLIKNAMKQHFSWENSAGEYIQLYKKAIMNKRNRSTKEKYL